MNIYNNPSRSVWKDLQKRSAIDSGDIEQSVSRIISDVARRGDDAIRELTASIDKFTLTDIEMGEDVICDVDPRVAEAISIAAENIQKFHEAQKMDGIQVETMPGVRCFQRSVPINCVGLYVPGGTAPLFSTVLMLAIPAMVAGCKDVILCSPPPVSPTIVYAARLCGVKHIYQVGGAMAIAAMAYGTETIPKADKIFGPGNQWVTTAKQIVSQSQTAIDMPAGPSEVMILADHTARAEFVAADMLSQAEHGADSQAIAICSSMEMAEEIKRQVELQVKDLSRADISRAALNSSRIIVLVDRNDMLDFANEYAAEHLIISLDTPWDAADLITNAGSVFIGNYSPESVGDYASGTNHTLPTYGWAKAYSGVNLDSFMRKITYQELSHEGLLSIGSVVQTMADAEGLTAHKNAVNIRINEN